MKKAKVWYRKEWDGFSHLDITRESLSETHAFVKEIEVHSLESTYYEMQGHIWSPNGEARNLIEALGLQHTSMSTGDIVEIDGTLYQVGFWNWLILDEHGEWKHYKEERNEDDEDQDG